MAASFVRKVYLMLDHEDPTVVSWDSAGDSFSIHDEKRLEDEILARYFRGHLETFRQQLLDFGFEQIVADYRMQQSNGAIVPVETYKHASFKRGNPSKLIEVVRVSSGKRRRNRKTTTKAKSSTEEAEDLTAPEVPERKPFFTDEDIVQWVPPSSADLPLPSNVPLITHDNPELPKGEQALKTLVRLITVPWALPEENERHLTFQRSEDGSNVVPGRMISNSRFLETSQLPDDVMESMLEWSKPTERDS
ncbi:hypothetical protein Poli38472_008281 [Pythium oligandrum]|uniref:HSF-type DNA-binding domain-containing protein n=1 Tax=Pythium oligandrum TaxID=41045 RepID=A0A8K1FLV5_PYTOL|nr:hypothetical protein Poli38472_008281 [Pythium oligandrum]|eukprot:TMW65639.1 hypothetical protein Poli38472_008281 [Pythium oligandrum]